MELIVPLGEMDTYKRISGCNEGWGSVSHTKGMICGCDAKERPLWWLVWPRTWRQRRSQPCDKLKEGSWGPQRAVSESGCMWLVPAIVGRWGQGSGLQTVHGGPLGLSPTGGSSVGSCLSSVWPPVQSPWGSQVSLTSASHHWYLGYAKHSTKALSIHRMCSLLHFTIYNLHNSFQGRLLLSSCLKILISCSKGRSDTFLDGICLLLQRKHPKRDFYVL